MPRWTVLGTAYSLGTLTVRNTHFLLTTTRRAVLIDVPEDVLPRLRQMGLSPNSLTDVILTHFHPDHVGGLPLFLQNLWLAGRTRSLTLHGPPDAINRARKMLDLFRWDRWRGMFPVTFRSYAGPGLLPMLRESDLWLDAAEVRHSVPALGLRFAFPESGRVLAYSTDTAPCEAVVLLARGADWLFHEATGAGPYHSTARQAGEVAKQAGVGHLFLVHTDPDPETRRRLEQEAQSVFPGPVTAAWDGLTLVW